MEQLDLAESGKWKTESGTRDESGIRGIRDERGIRGIRDERGKRKAKVDGSYFGLYKKCSRYTGHMGK